MTAPTEISERDAERAIGAAYRWMHAEQKENEQ